MANVAHSGDNAVTRPTGRSRGGRRKSRRAEKFFAGFARVSFVSRDGFRGKNAKDAKERISRVAICVHGDAIYRSSLGGEDPRGFCRISVFGLRGAHASSRVVFGTSPKTFAASMWHSSRPHPNATLTRSDYGRGATGARGTHVSPQKERKG